jgi:hypothetical protein
MELDKKSEKERRCQWDREHYKRNEKSVTYIYHDGILCEYFMMIAFQKP